MNRIVLVLLIVAFNIGIDQYTKQMAVDQIKGHPAQSYMGDFFRLVYAENTGAFLSLGTDFPPVLKMILLKGFPILVMSIMLMATLFWKDLSRIQIIALSFFIGGGISNVFDRVVNDGRVTDFLNIGIGNLRTGIFNVADMSILFGAFLLLLTSLQKDKEVSAE